MALTVQELIGSFLCWASNNLAPGTIREYRRHFDRFVAHNGNLQVSELRAHHVMLWGKTWHQIQAMQRLMNWACDQAELCDRNPFKKIKRPPIGERRRILQRPELLRLMRRSCRAFRDFLFGMRESLARPQEIRALCWEYLQWPGEAGTLRAALLAGQAVFVLDRYKAKDRRNDPNTPRIILVRPRLGRLLVRLLDGRGSIAGPVFLNCEGQPWSRNALRLQMRRLRRQTGLQRDHRGEHVVCYTLRHTMATAASASGVKDRILAELMGHTSTRTTARYQHLDVLHLATALATVKLKRVVQGGAVL